MVRKTRGLFVTYRTHICVCVRFNEIRDEYPTRTLEVTAVRFHPLSPSPSQPGGRVSNSRKHWKFNKNPLSLSLEAKKYFYNCFPTWRVINHASETFVLWAFNNSREGAGVVCRVGRKKKIADGMCGVRAHLRFFSFLVPFSFIVCMPFCGRALRFSTF